ncbi:hypothetical protein HII31_04070 [Pseudocercospora fuligena]|uniref:Uncharacterized protein n=1 Tax=Pseudocercospora fuligena TaxID=685502 RepID=A0A8H6VNE2_9PEZI|nr:hypothetical protein HII31_04070 [Pseudocercospora fuligena]
MPVTSPVLCRWQLSCSFSLRLCENSSMHFLPRRHHRAFHKCFEKEIARAVDALVQHPFATRFHVLGVGWRLHRVHSFARQPHGRFNPGSDTITLVLERAVEFDLMLPEAERQQVNVFPHVILDLLSLSFRFLVPCHNGTHRDKEAMIVEDVGNFIALAVCWYGSCNVVVPSCP